jgi:hypothetical protein
LFFRRKCWIVAVGGGYNSVFPECESCSLSFSPA